MLNDLSWDYLDIPLLNKPGLDLNKLNLKTKNQAINFLAKYGYDFNDPFAREELWRIYYQSISFIQSHLLKESEAIPSQYLEKSSNKEIVKLLLEASSGQENTETTWACAILRVMHVVLHLDHDIRAEYFNFARNQIFSSIEESLNYKNDKVVSIFSGKDEVKIVHFSKKDRKDKNSILIKLMAKPKAVSHEIYDRLGVKLITENIVDSIRLLNNLIKYGIVHPIHIIPDRTVNSLFDYSDFKETIYNQSESNDLSKIIEKINEQDYFLKNTNSKKNISSSFWYRALQVTCRHIIDATDSSYRLWQDISLNLRQQGISDEVLKKIPITIREKKKFFFPFEVQILDQKAFIESLSGRSRHEEYKKRQLTMARNRILRDLVC